MNTTEVLALLHANQNPRGIAHWDTMTHAGPKLSSFGIGLTQLRKLAKQIGRDHELAQALWQSENYDAKVIGLLIDEPKKLTVEQAEAQVEQLNHGMLAHVFASCNATLAKTPFVVELAETWMHHTDKMRRQCGYTLLYEISKNKKKSAPNDDFFLRHIDHIQATYPSEPQPVLMAMGAALMGVGKRNKVLNAACLTVAQQMGPIPGANGCEPFEVVKHLIRPALVKKLGS